MLSNVTALKFETGEGEHVRFVVMDVNGQFIIRETVNNFKGVFDESDPSLCASEQRCRVRGIKPITY